MSNIRNSEILINKFKKEFMAATGRGAKVLICSRWESEANFTDKGNFWALLKTIFDYTGWSWEKIYLPIKGSNGKVTKRCETQIFNRSLIDYILVNNGCKLVYIGNETDRDHTTVIHSVRKFEERLEIDMYTQKLFREIVENLKENYHLYKFKSTLKQEITGKELD